MTQSSVLAGCSLAVKAMCFPSGLTRWCIKRGMERPLFCGSPPVTGTVHIPTPPVRSLVKRSVFRRVTSRERRRPQDTQQA